jgi:PD-(D/E)XK nuclease superfamily protein
MGLFAPTKKQLGERSQAHIIARLLEVGYTVLTPYGDSSRYDLVIEDAEGQFWRVQCKTAWIENGGASIQFATTSLRTRSTNGKVKYSRAGYMGQVEYFAVYSHELHKTYLIPASHIGNATRMRLRLVPSKNNQEKGVKWAKDYEL